MKRIGVCKDCTYCAIDADDIGTCRFNAPIARSSNRSCVGLYVATFPEVNLDTGWCGEWRRRELDAADPEFHNEKEHNVKAQA